MPFLCGCNDHTHGGHHGGTKEHHGDGGDHRKEEQLRDRRALLKAEGGAQHSVAHRREAGGDHAHHAHTVPCRADAL